MKIKIGIIGGTGLEDSKIIRDAKEVKIKTKFGYPSSNIIVGKIGETEVALLSRHGKGHTLMPSKVPYQANIMSLKELGCTHIIATTACGSLEEKIKQGDLVFIDQFIDRTTNRKQTFYENNEVCHIPMAEPFCKNIRKTLSEEARKLNLKYHNDGTIITIEGPRFSSKSESKLYKSWNADLVNMTTIPEVVLARESGMHYAAIAISTDYDCWKANEKPVDISIVLETFKKNIENIKKLILKTIPKLENYESCNCAKDISSAIIKI